MSSVAQANYNDDTSRLYETIIITTTTKPAALTDEL